MKGKQAMGRKKSLTWSKIKMSSAKQTNKQVCAEASLLNKMEKKNIRYERKLEKNEWERKKMR